MLNVIPPYSKACSSTTSPDLKMVFIIVNSIKFTFRKYKNMKMAICTLQVISWWRVVYHLHGFAGFGMGMQPGMMGTMNPSGAIGMQNANAMQSSFQQRADQAFSSFGNLKQWNRASVDGRIGKHDHIDAGTDLCYELKTGHLGTKKEEEWERKKKKQGEEKKRGKKEEIKRKQQNYVIKICLDLHFVFSRNTGLCVCTLFTNYLHQLQSFCCTRYFTGKWINLSVGCIADFYVITGRENRWLGAV